MKATLYKELSNKQTPLELQAGLTVQEALPCFDLDNAIIVINGRVENYNYVLQEKDMVTIRLTPNGMTALIVTAIIVSVLAVGAGVVGGILAYNAREAAEKAKAELEKMKKLSNKPDIDNRPFLRGASNTLATGNNQPYIIGRHFFTPYLLCSPFYELAGTDGVDQYTYTVLECGFNKQVLKKIAIDDIIIKTFTESSPQEGGYNLDSGIFAEGGKIEIAQDGELLSEIPALNYKVDSKTCNDQIPHDSDVAGGTKEYLTYTLNPYAKDVDVAITFPYGLYAMNNDGDKIETQVTITPQYSLDGGTSWVDFTFNNNGTQTNLFKRVISTKELRYTAHKEFSASDYKTLKENNQTAIYIRVRSNGNKDSRIKNECYCLFYQSICFDPNKSTDRELVPCKVIEDRERAFCTIIGLKLKASKINEEKLKKINVITQGIARTWNGTKWSEEKTETRNPAAWALEIETSDSHPASRYEDGELDLESFGEFYNYCEDKGFKFDWVITQNTKKDDTLNHIMEATGACIYTDIYGRRAIAIDRPQENALAVYNPQNIISIQNKKTFGRRTDGLRIKYVNSKDDLYQEDTYLLMREVNGEPLELTPDSIIKDVNITGITTFEHIVKYARRLMAIEALRPKTTIIEVGNEGVFYTPYSKILIQDDSLKIGIGKGYTIKEVKWRSGLLKKIYTNELLTLEATETYGIIVNCFTEKDVKPVKIKVAGDGITNELIVLTKIKTSADAKPDTGCLFSFGEIDADGEFSKISTPYIISQIKRSDKGFSLELVNYNEAIYDTGKIPDYKSNITQKTETPPKPIPPDINGKDGITHYTWIKFAKDANGTDMSDYPDDTRRFMGIAENKLTQEESNDPADYKWVDMRGKDGIPGEPGKDGKPKFTWVKYADNAQGEGMSDNPEGKDYIGFAFNKDSQTESDNPADYHWQRVKGEQGEQGIPGEALSFPIDTDILSLLNFDETPQALPAPNPSFTAWKSKIIEYDCTDKTEIKMTFEEALNNVIILSGELKNDFILKLFFDKQNGNGAKQYLIVYKLTGNFNVTIQTEAPTTNKISQNISDKTFGIGCYAVVDFRGNVWAFEGNIKQSLIDEILKQTENKLNNNAQQTITNFKNEINNFYLQEKNKMNMFIQEKMDEIKNYHKDRFIKESGAIGEIRYFTSKKNTYGYLYANGYSFIPELYPEFYQFWLENFGDKKKKNYLGYDAFGYPKLPDLRGVALRAVDDGSGRGGADLALEYQGDAIRNLKGRVGVQGNDGYPNLTAGVFHTLDTGHVDSGTSQSSGYLRLLGFDASRIVPTAEDNRVKSYGVYPFIKVI